MKMTQRKSTKDVSSRKSKHKGKGSIDEDEDNDCEALIRLHKNVEECSLMTEGYHSFKQTYYFCSCDLDCQMPLCLACLQTCHGEHWKNKKITDLISDKRGALCFCGIRNHLLSDINSKGDFIYEEQCQFLEWSVTTKTYIFYEDINQPDEILCMFCYNLCKNKPKGYIRKCDDVLCHRLKCTDRHEDYLAIFEKFTEITNEVPFKFESFTGIQFLNMILMSNFSFENSFHRLLSTLETLEKELIKKNKQFDFISYINNSLFMKSLEKISNILFACKDMFYPTSIIDVSKFIFPLLQRKFNFKAQENIWILKRHLLDIYHKLTFRKDFEIIPILSVEDLLNLNPFQRYMYSSYIDLFPELNLKYFNSKKDGGFQKNHVDELLRTLDKYRTIKNKGEHAYEILKTIYSEIKKIVRMNKMSNEQSMKFYSLNDDIMCNAIEDKTDKLACCYSQMRMLMQMVESILYLAYFYNDKQLKKYFKNEIRINQVNFFHGNSETGKMIYKNTTHVLLYCRTIHQNCLDFYKQNEENLSNTEKMNLTTTDNMKTSQLIRKINKIHNKIMFKATEIISLTLNDPDEYIVNLKKILERDGDKYYKIFNETFTLEEQELIKELTNLINEIENTYQSFFLFEIKNDDIEKCIINKIRQFFSLIKFNGFNNNNSKLLKVPTFMHGSDDAKHSDFKKRQTKILVNLPTIQEILTKNDDDKFATIRLLINKTPFVFTVVKSLTMLLNMSDKANNIGQTYITSLFQFLSFYIHNCPDNCQFIMTSKILNSFLLLNTEYLLLFIDLLENMIKLIKKSNYCISQNGLVIKVVESLMERISDKSEYVFHLKKLIKILNTLCYIKYFHVEHAMNKIRKSIKNIYNKNPIFNDYKILLLKKDGETLKDRMRSREMIGNYTVESFTEIFTKFLRVMNFMFDGNSTLNENDFLSKVFTCDEILQILEDTSLNIKLRIELIKFFRLAYMDIIIDNAKLKKYVEIFTIDIKTLSQSNSNNFTLFQQLLKVNEDVQCLSNGLKLISFEIANYQDIMRENESINKKHIILYFENCLILPLSVFINTYISMIFTFDGYQYIKLYEITFNFLVFKKCVLDELQDIESDVQKSLNQSKSETPKESKMYYTILQKLKTENYNVLIEDIKKLKNLIGFDILNYKVIYEIFLKHSELYYDAEETENLDKMFSKKTGLSLDEEIEKKRKEYNKSNITDAIFKEKLINAILKYEKDKANYLESSLSQNLAEKNVIYDATYRLIMLRPIFYLINNEILYLKYRRQNLWHIFRLLQCDTANTQRDILELVKQDNEIRNKKPSSEQKITDDDQNKAMRKMNREYTNSSKSIDVDKIKIEIEKENNNIKLNEVMPVVDIKYLLDIFIENFLSLLFRSCNPCPVSENEDYKIAYMIIKIFKYMCEEHNVSFQTIFFKFIKIKTGSININVFDIMMCTLQKILIFAKWDQVNYDSTEKSISYFYDIFFCMIELAIEMIKGTSKENSLFIIDEIGHKNEDSYFYQFLLQAKGVLFNSCNDSEIVYNVRINILNFLQGFIEEKSTPRKIIILIENVYNPMSIFEIIITLLKKLYLKSINGDIKSDNKIEFNQEICKLFIDKYFMDSEFSKNKEFELSNSMYHYIKSLSAFNNKDAVSIIECTKTFDETKILNLRNINQGDHKDNNEDGESILIDPRYFEIYFGVKFFEAITRGVWVQGDDDKKPQYVLFTLDPTVLYLSQSSKNDFVQVVPRDTRSSKLFSLMEYTNYFYIEINQNKKKLSSNKFLRLLNKINYELADYILFLITVLINLIIFCLAESKDDANDYQKIHSIIFPIGIIQTVIALLFIIIWSVSKFSLFYTIEKEKYYVSHRINKEENLDFLQYLDVIIIRTILSRREMINFIWNLIFSIIGIISSRNIFAYSLQILIIVNITSTLRSITKAIIMRYKQILTFLMFLIVETYIFSTIAFYLLSKDFIHVNEGNQENTCGSLFFCFLSHLEFGLRTDGGIGEYIAKLSFLDTPAYFMGMFFFQFIFYIITIVIMLAVIGGSVIDTFAELRDKSREDLNDLNNKCFICNGTRDEIEKVGETFEEHIEKVHNIWDYVDYMIGLKYVDSQETNAINSFVIEQLHDKKISWFPSFIEKNDFEQSEDENEGDEEKNKDGEKIEVNNVN